MAASLKESNKSMKNYTLITLSSATTDESATAGTPFSLPLHTSSVALQVGDSDTTAQTVALQGSNDGTTFASITNCSVASAVDGTSKVLVLGRDKIGYFPFYRLANVTATKAVEVSLTYFKA